MFCHAVGPTDKFLYIVFIKGGGFIGLKAQGSLCEFPRLTGNHQNISPSLLLQVRWTELSPQHSSRKAANL